MTTARSETARRTVVAAGPTIDADAIRTVLPTAEVVEPIKFGDAFSYGLRAGDRLLIIDGLFLQQPAVRHKEILTLMDNGVMVAGCSSMGALRAAELHRHGMVGYGEVFRGYRDGALDADDEVAMVHGTRDDGYTVYVDALVNIRATLDAAVASRALPAMHASALLTAARQLPFTARSWPRVLAAGGIPAAERQPLAHALTAGRVDVKRADALLALTALAQLGGSETAEPAPPMLLRPRPTLWSVRWQQSWSPPTMVTLAAAAAPPPATLPVPVRDLDVLTYLRLCSIDDWQYLPALEQVAAWHGGSAAAPVTSRPGRQAEPYVRSLELIAHRYVQACGLADAQGLPATAMAYWLTDAELAKAIDDPVTGSALIATRTLLADPIVPENRLQLKLLRTDARFRRWQEGTARAMQVATGLAATHPRLNLLRPRSDKLTELFCRRWNSHRAIPEMARRGFATPESFHAAASPFAPAAATGLLPELHVGVLGSQA